MNKFLDSLSDVLVPESCTNPSTMTCLKLDLVKNIRGLKGLKGAGMFEDQLRSKKGGVIDFIDENDANNQAIQKFSSM